MRSFIRHALAAVAVACVAFPAQCVDMPICAGVSPAWNYSLSDWMSTLPDCVLMSELSMPSAHDAGVADDTAESSFKAWIIRSWCICQDGALCEQVELGVRFFDLRIERCDDDGDIDDFRAVHEIAGQSLRTCLDDVNAFLNCHPREFVVLRFSHWNSESEQNDCLAYVRQHAIAGRFLCRSDSPNPNALTLGTLRGKALVVVEWKGGKALSPAQGIWSLAETAGAGTLGVHDSYANKDSFSEMWADQQGKWASRAGVARATSLYMLCWQRTLQGATGIGDTNYDRAKDINPQLKGCLAAGIASGWGRPNLVNADFIDANLSRTVVNLNLEVLNKTLPVEPEKPPTGGCGGGVYTCGTFVMNGGSIVRCVASRKGGGVYAAGKVELNGGTIAFNTANGAVDNVGHADAAPSVVVTGGTFGEDVATNAAVVLRTRRPNEEVSEVISEADYAALFDVEKVKCGDVWRLSPTLKASVADAVHRAVGADEAQRELCETATDDHPRATVQTQAGLYYGIASAAELGKIKASQPAKWTLGDGTAKTVDGAKPSAEADCAFYQLRVTPNPSAK